MQTAFLVVIQSKNLSDNQLRAVRKIFSKMKDCKRITKMVYLVPAKHWPRVHQLVPRKGLIMFYSKEYHIIDIEGNESSG